MKQLIRDIDPSKRSKKRYFTLNKGGKININSIISDHNDEVSEIEMAAIIGRPGATTQMMEDVPPSGFGHSVDEESPLP